MATNTTPRGYRYPDGNEVPALDVLLGHLAQDVDADVQTIASQVGVDLAWSELTAAGGTFATNFSGYTGGSWQGVRVRRRNGWVVVTGAVTKSIALVAGEAVATLPAGLRPTYQVQGAVAPGGGLQINVLGEIRITPVPTATTFSFSVTYPVG